MEHAATEDNYEKAEEMGEDHGIFKNLNKISPRRLEQFANTYKNMKEVQDDSHHPDLEVGDETVIY